MNQSEHNAILQQASETCVVCGYEMCENKSGVCPECGAPVCVPLRYSEQEILDKAKEVLGEAELVIHTEVELDNEEPLGFLTGYESNHTGVIWVPYLEYENACDILQANDILTPRCDLPIQDKSEPYCPECNHDMDTELPGVCPTCGYTFTWVEIGEPEIDTTGRTCIECGYNLTGNETAKCPECGALLSDDLDAVVETALSMESRVDDTRDHHAFQKIMYLVAGTLALFFILFILFNLTESYSSNSVVIGSVISIVAVLFLVHIVISRGKKSTEK